MIVYYDPETFNIKGMSHQVDTSRQDPYFETDDPLALNIFLGKEKALKYIAVIRTGAKHRGTLKLKSLKSTLVKPITHVVHKISKNIKIVELQVLQNITNKSISIILPTDILEWWKVDPNYNTRRIHLTACKDDDPYKPLWIKSISSADFENNSTFNYTGTDKFTLYTVKLFDSYSHEITSC